MIEETEAGSEVLTVSDIILQISMWDVVIASRLHGILISRHLLMYGHIA